MRSVAKEALAGTPASGDSADSLKVQKTRSGPRSPRLRAVRSAANSPAKAPTKLGNGRLASRVEVAVLRYLAGHPGSSGTEVRRGAGIRSGSQTWALLARLEREGLLVNESRGSSEKAYKNAWRLSAQGESVLADLPRGMYAGASA